MEDQLRHRDDSFVIPGTTGRVTKTETDLATGVITVTKDVSGYEYDSYTSLKSMTDVVTPNFKKRIAAGEIINSPMTLETTVINNPLINFYNSYESSTKFYEHNGSIPVEDWTAGRLPEPTLSIDTEALISKALTSARGNASLTEAQSLASAGEMRETVSSIGQIMYRFYKIYRAVRRSDLKYLKRQISKKELADRYMEYRYAIRPLVYDVQQHVDALRSETLVKGSRQTFRGYESASDYAVNSQTVDDTGSSVLITDRFSKSRSVSVRAGEMYELTKAMNGLKFGLTDLTQTAWELTPFSFIIDWFINLGDVISALSPKAGLVRRASWYVIEDTITVEKTRSQQAYDSATHKNNVSNVPVAPYVKITTTKNRVPNPYFDYAVHMDVNLNLFKLLDLGVIMSKLKKARR